MKKITVGISMLCLVIGISACSRKKDTFINRNFHAVTAKYNTLYNGNVALQQGKQQIDDSYFENFWDLLPVERMEVSEDIALPGTTKNEFFKVAEEKATKAIQKHSMPIASNEKNPEIDEAYLLLGKARYYDQRFIPALEAFNYILHKYPASNTINEAQIWREKTNIRLGNNTLALKNLKRVLDAERLNDQDLADANAFLAQAYINLDDLDSALVPIKIAAEYTNQNQQKGRYYYIQGQLYNRFKMRDSANYAFDKVLDLNRKSPREYYVNAQLAQSRNFNFSENNSEQLLENLKEMEANRENRPYLDKIYFQLAEYYNHIDSTARAIDYYNQSLAAKTNDNFLQSVNYETLGNINFDLANFRNASAYYDSTLTKIPKKTRDYFVIQRKRDNLKEVILYEKIAEENDSILKLVAMKPDERLNYFTRYADSLKQQAVSQAEKGEIAQAAPPIPVNPGAVPPTLGGPSPGNVFYFYNPSRVASGRQEFLRLWGPRELKDNWRTSSGAVASAQPGKLDEVSNLIIDNNPNYNPQTYLSQLPQDPAFIDSLTSSRNDAYYRLGLIYKEKYNKNELALERLKSLLNYTAEERMVVPATYYLYEIYAQNGNTAEAESYKNSILNTYPNSKYAAYIKNPGLALKKEDLAQEQYESMYKLFEKGQFQQVIDSATVYSSTSKNNDLLSKTELLKAMAIGRLEGIDAYKKAVYEVAANYPQSEAGKKAQQLYNTAIPKLENLKFTEDGIKANLNMLYVFKKDDEEKAKTIQEKIDRAINDLSYKLSTSLDVYTKDEVFVLVHGFHSKSRAQGFSELLQINKKYKIAMEPIIISSENYRIVQLYKNLEKYMEFQNPEIPNN